MNECVLVECEDCGPRWTFCETHSACQMIGLRCWVAATQAEKEHVCSQCGHHTPDAPGWQSKRHVCLRFRLGDPRHRL